MALKFSAGDMYSVRSRNELEESGRQGEGHNKHQTEHGSSGQTRARAPANASVSHVGGATLFTHPGS